MTRRAKYLFLKGKKCACCGKKDKLTIDHIKPKSYGYTVVGNKQPLCRKCNSEKGILIIDYNHKTMELEPWMFRLTNEGLRKAFNDTSWFSSVVYNFSWKRRKEFFNE
jgi:hypothetical protein